MSLSVDLELRALLAKGEAELRIERSLELHREAERLRRRAQANRVVASEVRIRRPHTARHEVSA